MHKTTFPNVTIELKLWPLFYGWGSTASRIQNHYGKLLYLLQGNYNESVTETTLWLDYIYEKMYDLFLLTGFNWLKAAESLQGGSLLLSTKYSVVPGTNLIKLGRMSQPWSVIVPGTLGLGIQCPNHQANLPFRRKNHGKTGKNELVMVNFQDFVNSKVPLWEPLKK